jgi:hypothetical protein
LEIFGGLQLSFGSTIDFQLNSHFLLLVCTCFGVADTYPNSGCHFERSSLEQQHLKRSKPMESTFAAFRLNGCFLTAI